MMYFNFIEEGDAELNHTQKVETKAQRGHSHTWASSKWEGREQTMESQLSQAHRLGAFAFFFLLSACGEGAVCSVVEEAECPGHWPSRWN